MSSTAVDADAPYDAEDDVLPGNAGGQAALHADFHGAGLELPERLGGQDVLNLRGADANSKGAQRTVGRSMAVAADHGLAWLSVT